MPTELLQLDTSREDWRRQARSIGTCKGQTCKAKILWVIAERRDGRERWTAYNHANGMLHRTTCPDAGTFGRQPAPTPTQSKPESKKPAPKQTPQPLQPTLFSSGKYGVD